MALCQFDCRHTLLPKSVKWEEVPDFHWTGGRLGPRVSLDTVEEAADDIVEPFALPTQLSHFNL
jgi:hypothetical protein